MRGTDDEPVTGAGGPNPAATGGVDPTRIATRRRGSASVELVVDDSERQLLTPVLRHFVAQGYHHSAPADDDEIILVSDGGHVSVRSRPAVIDLADPIVDGSVTLAITASDLDDEALRAAVTSAITALGGLTSRTHGAETSEQVFHDQRGVRRAVLRSISP